MAQALSCTLPWRMTAVAASGGANLTDLCPDSPATDVMVLHGSADPIAPTTGSDVPFATPNGLHIDDVVATDAGQGRLRARRRPTEQLFADVVVDRYVGLRRWPPGRVLAVARRGPHLGGHDGAAPRARDRPDEPVDLGQRAGARLLRQRHLTELGRTARRQPRSDVVGTQQRVGPAVGEQHAAVHRRRGR